jgi:hypothetical protein
MDVNILLKDEISVILLWIGLYNILDQIISLSTISPYKNYIYILFILIAIFLKLPN